MAANLNVDPTGLRSAAASSEVLAATLGAAPATADAGGDQETHAAVAALDAAIAVVRTDQSKRVAQQAAHLNSASRNYEVTDEGAADRLAETT